MFDEIIKYLLEGIAIAVVAWYIPQRNMDPRELLIIAVSVTLAMILLDRFAPRVAHGTRQGMGFGIGLGQVGVQLGGNIEPEGRCLSCGKLRTSYVTDSDFGKGQFEVSPMIEGMNEGMDEGMNEGMDDPQALDYYSHEMIPDNRISSNIGPTYLIQPYARMLPTSEPEVTPRSCQGRL